MFNYFSHTQDLEARFLITDLVRALKSKDIFRTSPDNIVRDFITPADFFGLVSSLIGFEGHINQSVDCYTRAPIDKFSLLQALGKEYSLEYEFQSSFVSVNATGEKVNYYSLNKAAGSFGYEPCFTSIEGLLFEIERVQGIKWD
ncbi:hypothetical protein D3C78_1489260 [compost metagenome]